MSVHAILKCQMVTMSNPSKIYWIEMNQLAPDLLSLRLSLGHISARSFKRIKNKSIVKSSRCLCITSGAGLRDVIMTASLKVRGQNCSRAGMNKMDYSLGKNERPWGSLRLIKIGFPLWIT